MCELRDKATIYKETGLVAAMDADAIAVKSDSIVPDWLRESLVEGVRLLENIPDRLKDWHPGSDQMVLNLVHPSLCPLAYGRTRVLPRGRVPLNDCLLYTGLGEIAPEHTDGQYDLMLDWLDTASMPAWGQYQWLPTEVEFTTDGWPRITSYINNLHPQTHISLYNVLEHFVNKSIPLWNECLSRFQNRPRIEVSRTSNDDYKLPEGVRWPRRNTGLNLSAADQKKDDDLNDIDWSFKHRLEDDYLAWWEDHRVLVYPEPREFTPLEDTLQVEGARRLDLKTDYKDSGLQVIFKLANIHLTPEKPVYNGGSWHVEGALNEHICATALYYYDSVNIEPSHLAFRQPMDGELMRAKPEQVSSEQNQHLIWKCTNHAPE